MNTDISHLALEVRACACGCGKTFKCLPSSPQKLWVRWHSKEFLNKGLKYDEDFNQETYEANMKRKGFEGESRRQAEWRAYLAQTRIANKKGAA